MNLGSQNGARLFQMSYINFIFRERNLWAKTRGRIYRQLGRCKHLEYFQSRRQLHSVCDKWTTVQETVLCHSML